MNVQNSVLKHLFRADLYRILALGFDAPTSGNLEAIKEITEGLLELVLETECSKDLADALCDLVEIFPQDAKNLEGEYHRLFGTHVACPSAEGSYQQVERGPIIGDVSAFYAAFQMKVLEKQGPPDSLKMELGFMSFMALKTAYALENGLKEEREIVEEAQTKFLSSHLGRWAKCFSTKLKEVSENVFYQNLAALLEQWIAEDCQWVNASPVLLQEFELKEEGEVSCALGNLK